MDIIHRIWWQAAAAAASRFFVRLGQPGSGANSRATGSSAGIELIDKVTLTSLTEGDNAMITTKTPRWFKASTVACAVTALTLMLGIVGPPAFAAGSLVKFDGGIGVDPVAGINPTSTPAGLPVRNDVHGVPPGGRPWVIERLRVVVKDDGRISAKGEGLLLAATDAIGTPGGVREVAATLFCGAQAFDSGAAAIDAHGDFEIGGVLNGVPPNPCASPVLLIRNFAAGQLGAWFAAGILKD